MVVWLCSFATFCASAIHDCPEIPRGVDEMLFDSYLQSLPSINWDTDPRILLRAHVHRIAQSDTTDEESSDSSEASQVSAMSSLQLWLLSTLNTGSVVLHSAVARYATSVICVDSVG